MEQISSQASQSSSSLHLDFELHPRQADVAISSATEVLFGGAASGGKSHLARVLAILWCIEIPGLQIYLFRRLYDDLIKNHLEGPTGFRAMLAPWTNARHPKSPFPGGRLCEIVQGEIRFWNGSKIFLCHLQHQKDLSKYYGPEFHVLFLEEATQFSEFMIRFLRSRMRIPKALKIPDKYLKPKEVWKDPNEPEYLFPRAIYTSNPGGIGHDYIKKSFIKDWKPYELHYAPESDAGHLRQYIPAKVDDNPSVRRDAVKANLSGLPAKLVDAMLSGDWSAVVGAYFPEIDPAKHIIKPFDIPSWWPHFCAMDYGACGEGDPFAIGWGAVSDGSIPGIPREAIVWYRIWYGKGLPKVTVEQIANGIHRRELKDPKILWRVAGGDITQERGTGPSAYEMFSTHGLYFQRADMRRLPGWMQMQERFVGKDSKSLMYFFPECEDALETVAQLQHDLNNPNDCAPGEDHVADMIRYGCMSRPWVRQKPEAEKTLEEKYRKPTLDELWTIRDQQLGNERR